MREAVEEAKPLLWPTVVVVDCTSLGLLEVFMVVVVILGRVHPKVLIFLIYPF